MESPISAILIIEQNGHSNIVTTTFSEVVNVRLICLSTGKNDKIFDIVKNDLVDNDCQFELVWHNHYMNELGER